MRKEERDITCFFTGHRRISQIGIDKLIDVTDKCIGSLAERGYVNFLCGGAVGFDTFVACRIIALSRRYPNIRLVLVLPCRDQTLKWKKTYDISLYQRIKGYASEVIYTGDCYDDGCMLRRNRIMADLSSVCIAYYNGIRRGGTAYTVNYAAHAGLSIINTYDKLKKL